MRVYYDTTGNVIVVRGTKDNYPPTSLTASEFDGQVSIWLRGEDRRLVGPINWSVLRNGTGQPFADLTSAMTHLNEVFSRKPEIDDGGVEYETIFEGSLV